MGSSHKSKSVRAKSSCPGESPSAHAILPKAFNRVPGEVPKIPAEVLDEIENQRGALVTVITLLHCLHIVLEHREDGVSEEPNPRIEAWVSWASLPEMTAMLLERTHAVLSALDPLTLVKASKAVRP